MSPDGEVEVALMTAQYACFARYERQRQENKRRVER